MAYPLPCLYGDDREERRDFEYMKSLYPGLAKRLLPYVEEECDRMEYENSVIFDEYPDKLQLRLMCVRVCGQARKYEKDLCPEQDASLRDFVEVMVYQEVYRRRCGRRRGGRKLYGGMN